MTPDDLMRAFFCLLFGGTLAFSIGRRIEMHGGDMQERRKAAFSPMLLAGLLPMFFLLLFAALLFTGQRKALGEVMLSICFSIFFVMSVYYVFLALLLPLLRRRYSAQTCALLWLLPTYLYLLGNAVFWPSEPKWILRVGKPAIRIVVILWVAGFAAVLLYYFITHFIFRRRVLRSAWDVVGRPQAVFCEEEEQTGVKKLNLRLVCSDAVTTPLSVGLFRRTTVVVLPHLNYSEDDLRLIFRHELIHVCRSDGETKFFLAFCRALCWFNPLVWFAMRRSAEDLELSCDETVLAFASDETRRRYADLILRTAGDGRGFTTCLSADAGALRYRLRSILSPGRPWSGAILAGVLFFLLLYSGGSAALAWEDGPLSETWLPAGQYEVRSIAMSDDHEQTMYECNDPAALAEWFGSLRAYRLSGNYRDADADRELTVVFYLEGRGLTGFDLCGDRLTVTPFSGRDYRQEKYYLPDAPDWDSLLPLLTPLPPEEPEEWPSLSLLFEPQDELGSEPLWAGRRILERNGEAFVDEFQDTSENGGVYGVSLTGASLIFAPCVPDEFAVTVEPFDPPAGSMDPPAQTVTDDLRASYLNALKRSLWDYAFSKSEAVLLASGEPVPAGAKEIIVVDGLSVEGSTIRIDGAALASMHLPLAPYSARYTVTASFGSGLSEPWKAEFSFVSVPPEENADFSG